jgi:ribosomal protein RSM22 (predicted rRNA methylase)
MELNDFVSQSFLTDVLDAKVQQIQKGYASLVDPEYRRLKAEEVKQANAIYLEKRMKEYHRHNKSMSPLLSC